MPNDPGAGDPLVRAIAECRAELDRLIDDQAALLNGREEPLRAEPRARRAPRPAPVSDPPEPVSDDPRQRLDALAKRLDGRLKRATAEGGREPSPFEEGDAPCP